MTGHATAETGGIAIDPEPRELASSNMITGAHLWATATGFFFIGFVFTYFYLRVVDNGGMWRPKGVDPSVLYGTASTAAVVGAAIAMRMGLVQQRQGHRSQWRREGAAGLLLLIAAIGLQVAAWIAQDFGPTQGGYASVYVGWTAAQWVFLIGSTYWLETVLATAIRYRKIPDGGLPPPGHASGDSFRREPDIADPLSLVRPQLTAVSFYLILIASIAVISWVILYLL
jgi:heme/copper-type cytochrome/quinol oxidase subunit 3